MIEKIKKIVDKRDVLEALMTDLSKTFDCIPYDLRLFRIDHSKTTIIRFS